MELRELILKLTKLAVMYPDATVYIPDFNNPDFVTFDHINLGLDGNEDPALFLDPRCDYYPVPPPAESEEA